MRGQGKGLGSFGPKFDSSMDVSFHSIVSAPSSRGVLSGWTGPGKRSANPGFMLVAELGLTDAENKVKL